MATNIQHVGSFDILIRKLAAFLQDVEQRLLDVESEAKLRNGDLTQALLLEQQTVFNAYFSYLMTLHVKHGQTQTTSKQRARDGQALRIALKPFLDQAPMLARCIARPRGYSGDSEMMRMTYADTWEGESLLGKLMHKYFMGIPMCQAVRNRRTLIASEVLSLQAERLGASSTTPLDVMSVACGPAQEVADLIAIRSGNINFTLLDQDAHAMQEAKANVTAAQKCFGSECTARFIHKSIGILLKHQDFKQTQQNLGQFDFIYSMGLYDYLDAKTAKRLTTSLLTLLRPGGTLLLGNFKENDYSIIADHWGDWQLITRTEDELRALVEPGLAEGVTVGTEPSGTQFFLKAVRAAVAVDGRDVAVARL